MKTIYLDEDGEIKTMDKDGAIMELSQLLEDLKKIARGERVYSFSEEMQQKMYDELRGSASTAKEEN